MASMTSAMTIASNQGLGPCSSLDDKGEIKFGINLVKIKAFATISVTEGKLIT